HIVLKALRNEPEQRYLSVAQFSEDIRRHLEGLPVLAQKATFAYYAGKFVKRNKLSVAAAGGVICALVAVLAATLWEARAARAERDHARIEGAKAARINKFFQTMLRAADPR